MFGIKKCKKDARRKSLENIKRNWIDWAQSRWEKVKEKERKRERKKNR